MPMVACGAATADSDYLMMIAIGGQGRIDEGQRAARVFLALGGTHFLPMQRQRRGPLVAVHGMVHQRVA